MADLALVVVCVDGLWRGQQLVPPEDRAAVQELALAGLRLVLQTADEEAALREVRWMLRMDPIPMAGPEHHTEVNGRVVVTGCAEPALALDRLAEALSRDPRPFTREHVLVIGSQAADLPLMLAAGVAGYVPVGAEDPVLRATADHLAPWAGESLPGIAETIGRLALTNNTFLRPGAGGGQGFGRL